MIRDVVIDSHLFDDPYFAEHCKEIMENMRLKTRILVLTFDDVFVEKYVDQIRDLGDTELLHLKNKTTVGTDILNHFYDKHDPEFADGMEKIQWGKNILYLDKFGSFTDFFRPDPEEIQECMGFPLLKLCAFCLFGCKYCFLNVTYRKQRVLTKHFNFKDMKRQLGNYKKKHGSLLFNCGETGDPRDIVKYLNETYWADVCNAVVDAGHKLFCLTKSPYHKDLYEDEKLAGKIIYACSLSNEPFRRAFERVTASNPKKIEFLKIVQDLGYEIRFRDDPLHVEGLENLKANEVTDDVLDPIYKTFDACVSASLDPTIITLSTLRFKKPAFYLMKNHIPIKDPKAFVYEMGRFRLKRDLRKTVITKVADYARGLFPRASIGDCKDNVLQNKTCVCQP